MEHKKNLTLAAEELCLGLLPEKMDPELANEIEEFQRVVTLVRTKLGKLVKHEQERKFRNHPEELEDSFLRSSQYSLFQSQSQESLGTEKGDSEEYMELIGYKPITDQSLSPKQRNLRVKPIQEMFNDWCREQGCSVSQLAGLLIHKDNYTQRSQSCQDWLGLVHWCSYRKANCNQYQSGVDEREARIVHQTVSRTEIAAYGPYHSSIQEYSY